MDPLLINAASGMKARMESLDMLANNLANSGTNGFKADREFYTLFQSASENDGLPLIDKRWTDFSQGSILPTGNPLDLALDGKGFFALNSPTGVVYSRNGSFQISPTNQLVNRGRLHLAKPRQWSSDYSRPRASYKYRRDRYSTTERAGTGTN